MPDTKATIDNLPWRDYPQDTDEVYIWDESANTDGRMEIQDVVDTAGIPSGTTVRRGGFQFADFDESIAGTNDTKSISIANFRWLLQNKYVSGDPATSVKSTDEVVVIRNNKAYKCSIDTLLRSADTVKFPSQYADNAKIGDKLYYWDKNDADTKYTWVSGYPGFGIGPGTTTSNSHTLTSTYKWYVLYEPSKGVYWLIKYDLVKEMQVGKAINLPWSIIAGDPSNTTNYIALKKTAADNTVECLKGSTNYPTAIRAYKEIT